MRAHRKIHRFHVVTATFLSELADPSDFSPASIDARIQAGYDDAIAAYQSIQAKNARLTTVNLMLALEEHFNVEFLDRMLGRRTFGSIRSLSEAIGELLRTAAPPLHAGAAAEARAAP